MRLPEELRLELKQLYQLAVLAQQRLDDGLRLSQKALGLPPNTPVDLDTGEITMSPDDPSLQGKSETEIANIIENSNAEQGTSPSEPAATPAAQAAADDAGVDLTQVEGTGADGKITKADVMSAASAPEAPNAPAEPAATSNAESAVESPVQVTEGPAPTEPNAAP